MSAEFRFHTLQLRYKQKAMRTVRTHVKLISEQVKSDDMVKAIRDTAAADWKGDSFQSSTEKLGPIMAV